MKASVRIPFYYFAGAALWLAGSDWALSHFPMPVPSLLRAAGFALVTTLLVYVLLRRESQRRDRVEDGLRHMAIHDPLTGLLNRASFLDRLEAAVEYAAITGVNGAGQKVGVVFVDLDGFKAVNDTHGHHVGDRLLVEVAKRIQGVARSGDQACRFGGDEFVVMVHGDREEGCKRLADRLVEALHAPIFIEGVRVSLTASVGFAMYPDHGMEGHHLLRAADLAMYRVKGQGKDAAMEAFPTAA